MGSSQSSAIADLLGTDKLYCHYDAAADGDRAGEHDASPSSAAVVAYKNEGFAQGGVRKVKCRDVEANNKYILLYFSVSTCPPCIEFTKTLAEFYLQNHKTHQFEVIALSWEANEGDFMAYWSGMPWLAMPHTFRDQFRNVVKDLRVTAPPTLVIFDLEKKGEGPFSCVVNSNCRAEVEQHMNDGGEGFPWATKDGLSPPPDS